MQAKFPETHRILAPWVMLLAGLIAGCEEYPRDPEKTTEMVMQSHQLRVGVLHNPPWTNVGNGSFNGREVELVKRFAESLDARPVWESFGMHEGFKALERGDVDMLIGGLVRAVPYRNAAYTRPYTRTRSEDGDVRHHVLAVRQGENRFLVTLERFLDETTQGAP